MRFLILLCGTSLTLSNILCSRAFGAENLSASHPEASVGSTSDGYTARETASPDGRFAVHTFGEPDRKVCVLRAFKSGEVFVRVGAGFRSSLTLWSADSQAVAVVLQDGSSAPSTVKIFARRQDEFVEQTLPELRPPKLRPRDENDSTLGHWLCYGRWEPVCWKQDGALVLIGHSEASGSGSFAHAWTVLTLVPQRQERWAIAGETRRYSNAQTGGPTSKLTGKVESQ